MTAGELELRRHNLIKKEDIKKDNFVDAAFQVKGNSKTTAVRDNKKGSASEPD